MRYTRIAAANPEKPLGYVSSIFWASLNRGFCYMLLPNEKSSPSLLQKLWANEDGQDLVEYILLFMFVVVAAIAGLVVFGGRILALFQSAIGTF